MAAASSSAPTRARSAPRRRSGSGRGPAEPWWLRVRWDRVGRTSLLVVLVGLMALYIGPLRSYLATWRQSHTAGATVSTLERDHRALVKQHSALADPRNLERRARALGMVRQDERSYVVTGLPKR
jgi:hypothetical protein